MNHKLKQQKLTSSEDSSLFLDTYFGAVGSPDFRDILLLSSNSLRLTGAGGDTERDDDLLGGAAACMTFF